MSKPIVVELTDAQKEVVYRFRQIAINAQNVLDILSFPNGVNSTPAAVQSMFETSYSVLRADVAKLEALLSTKRQPQEGST